MELKGKKILVTGGAGFVGSHVVKKLPERGVPRENILAPRSSEFDLRKKENCESVVAGMDVVIHLAGLTGSGVFHKEHPGEVFYDNIIIGVQLMDAARAAGVKKFVVAGSATEYPEGTPLPFREEDIWKGFPESAHAPYAIAKRALLLQGQAYRAQYNFNAIHLLLSSMFGPFAKTGSGPVPALVERITEAKNAGDAEAVVEGTGKATRDFLYIEDAAEAIVAAVERYDKPEPVNIGSGEETSIADLASAIAEIIGFAGALKFDPTKSRDETRRVLDVSKAEREFGFHASMDLKKGLRKTIEWYNSEHATGSCRS